MVILKQVSFYPVGDSAIQIVFREKVSKALNQQIQTIKSLIEQNYQDGIVEVVPTFQAITIYYEPHLITYNEIKQNIKHILEQEWNLLERRKEIVHIPTCYDIELGEDLQAVANFNRLSKDEVIHLHTNTDYLVYMIGFLPGFPYLGGLSNRLATPRKETPRTTVPKGAVGIGGNQTGIYPIESPGGWNLIGRTPVSLYSPDKKNPFLLKAGDYIRFVPISIDEYVDIEKKVNQGTYEVIREVVNDDESRS